MRPNILVIIAHDLGTHLGCYGAPVQTPALDGLAAEGARFTNHFSTAPICSPSRGAIVTGKYPHCNGLMGLVNLGWDLPHSNVTLAQLLDSAGYETCLFGFQHEVKDPNRLNHYFHSVSDRTQGYSCERVAPLVADFLKSRRTDASKPFYARVGFSETHRPYNRYEPDDPEIAAVPPYMKDTPDTRNEMASFQGAVRTMDHSVGEILEALESTGLSEDTIVVFTTDHGIAFPRAKATLYDPGIRTTLIIRWPGTIEPDQSRAELLSNIDLLPTLLEAVEIQTPEDVQGRSFWPLLNGAEYEPNTRVFAEKNTSPDDIKRCIRTEQYKYIRNYSEGPGIKLTWDVDGSWLRKDIEETYLKPAPAVEMYDLAKDPVEVNNLAGRPEVAEIEGKLAIQLDQFLEETNDPVLLGPIKRPPEEAELIARVGKRKRR